MSATKVQAWISVGYQLLAAEGMEGMKIERLARMLKLNKSGFYYYFGSMQAFVGKLLEHHVTVALVVSEEISSCDSIDPDLVMVVVRHKDFFLVESHLVVESKMSPFTGDFETAGKLILTEFVQLWRKTSGLLIDPVAALAWMNIIRYFFYARIDQDHINYQYLHTLIAETSDVLNKVLVRPDGLHLSRADAPHIRVTEA